MDVPTKKASPWILAAQAYLAASLVLRIVLWWKFARPVGVSELHLPFIVLAGLLNDLVLLVYLSLPGTLIWAFAPKGWRNAKGTSRISIGLFVASVFGAIYLSVTEYYFFEEFQSRFNLVAVDYLIYPHEVFVNIWDTYPVGRVLTVTLGAALAFGLAIRRRFEPSDAEPPKFGRRLGILAVHAAVVTLLAIGVSTRSLALTGDRIADELVANGISSLFRAFRTNQIDFDHYYRTGDSRALEGRINSELADRGETSFASTTNTLTRRGAVHAKGLGRLNVVILLEEAFGGTYVGACGDLRGLTPRFDELAKQGLFFANAYATGTRTVRGIEAIAASFPPIPTESIVKRPGFERARTLGEVFAEKGYATGFLYGGFAAFDNMGPFFRSHGFEVRDRSDIPSPRFANIWGISDEDLFADAIRQFDRLASNGRPFFSLVLSTSNHQPFTFPPGLSGIPPKGGGRKAGIRYADHAIGAFFDAAKTRPWYQDTIFIVVADHGARIYGSSEIPVPSYHIPLLILAPGKLSPRTIEAPASQIDVAPTLLGLLGMEWSAPFFGTDVLASSAPHPIFLSHNYDVALALGDEVAVLGFGKRESCFHWNHRPESLDRSSTDERMLDLATAYYQLAFEAFRDGRLS